MTTITQNTHPAARAARIGQLAHKVVCATISAPATFRAILVLHPINFEQEIAKAARREAARRATDNLMR